MYSGPESAVGSVYSLKVPEFGKNRKTLFVVNSVPNIAIDPEIVVVAKLVVDELAVGIAHSRNVSVDGSN
jgi:hypothetical protein